jgi:predicted  nucleic acid-binding Zn-ribbon protein
MAGLTALLRELHRLHRQARDLREHIDRLPSQMKIQKAKVTRHEQALVDCQNALKQLKVTIHDKELTLKETHQQIDKYEGQLNTATAMKEYRALQTEIANARKLCSRLEDEILLAMTETDERKAALPGLEQAAQNAREELARFDAEAAQKQANVSSELNNVMVQLKDAEKSLPEDVQPLYERLVTALGAEGLVPVRDRTCTNCSTGITAQNHNDLMRDRFLLCKSCGRILYLPE